MKQWYALYVALYSYGHMKYVFKEIPTRPYGVTLLINNGTSAKISLSWGMSE